MKKTMITILTVFMMLSLSGCFAIIEYIKGEYEGYSGENPELLSVAVNSLLGIDGIYQHEIYEDAKIQIIEKDEYGRVLFAYGENSQISTFNFLIMQKSDEEFAYFYPHYNFISTEGNGISQKIFDEYISTKFSERELEILKQKNDWGKPMDDRKSVQVPISRFSNQPSIQIPEESFEKMFRIIAAKKDLDVTENIYRYCQYARNDSYERALYYARGIDRGHLNSIFYDIIVVFNPDGSYNENICVMELSDHYSYQDELKAFLELNHWEEPWVQ